MPYRSVFRPDLFAGQTIVITGGGSGIGRCTAHEIASLGGRAVLVGRKEEKLRRTAGEIEADGGVADVRVCDIRAEDAVRDTVASILEAHGRIHGLVNNAGGQFPAPLAVINQKGWETVVRTNLTGGFLMSREVFTQCMADGGGSIVNIVADMWNGMPMMGHSGAARAGMINFTMTAASEWGFAGVRVNAVAPGWIASSGFDHYDPSTQELIRSLGSHVPLRRVGNEAEVSAAICFLLSEAAAFISGATLRVDGAAPNVRMHVPLTEGPGTEPFDGFHRYVPPKVLED